MAYVPSLELLRQLTEGNPWALGRLISRAEAAVAEARPALAEVYRRAGRAHVIGLTGVPGSGKSTLVARLTASLRARGEKVGIVAIDPSSPYSGGAILGDRIRMTELANDPGVFIRSMATRGATGGMARAALDAVDLLDVAGFGTVILETVGVGQDEVEVAHASDTTVVVSAPGLGDEIQAIKAGVLEIADIHVVSKCDRDDALRTLTDLKQMLTLGTLTGHPHHAEAPVCLRLHPAHPHGRAQGHARRRGCQACLAMDRRRAVPAGGERRFPSGAGRRGARRDGGCRSCRQDHP